MKKRLARVLAATLAASTVLTGCGGGSEKKSVNGKAPEKQKITEDVTKTEGEINVWTNLSQDEMNFYVEEFNKIVPGVKVNVTVMPSKEYRTKLQNAFRTGTNAPDVATFEISDFGVYKDSDMLENLSQEQYGADAISKDMIPYVDELSSWDKIVETGKQVYEKSGGKIALLDDVESVLQLYASYKGQAWVDENNHIIDDEYMLEMYEMMDTVVKNKVDAEADMWSAGWTSGMYSKDMFILTCLPTWGLNFCIKPGIPADEMDKAANTWGYMQAPIPYQNGGTWYGMYSKSENKDAAWAWIKTMTSNEDYLVNGLANTWGDFPGYIPAIERCIEEGHTDIVTGDQQYFADFYETAKNVKGDPMTKYDRQAWASATAQMDLIATGQTTPEEAVEGFKEEMKNIYPEIEID